MLKRHPSQANNSEDEGETRNPADFVSFPTIPDPEEDNGQTLTKMLTKTLRKVTTNASNLVLNYSYTSPRARGASNLTPTADTSEHRLLNLTPDIDDIDNTPIHIHVHPRNPNTAIQRHSSGDAVSPPIAPHPESREPTPDDMALKRGLSQILTSAYGIMPPYIALKANLSIESVPLKVEENIKNRTSTLKDDVLKSKPTTSKTDDTHKHRPIHGKRAATIDDFSAPRVTSDNKSLRLSTFNMPSVPVNSSNNSVTSSIINVNALVAPGDVSSDSTSSARFPKKKSSSGLSAKGKTLQSKISSIFNNLPNDIELSDDSGSDLETINNSSTSTSPTHNHGLISYNQSEKSKPTKRLTSSNHHPSCYDITLYSESTAKSSPIKAELKRSYTNNSLGDSPTLSTIYALRSKDQHGHMKKKTSSNLSTVFFDNAKSIINNNLAVNVTSSTPFHQQRKKKKRPKRSSENPLKNGGIPRKYWMNNSFVSDCLNCFKPFTAFRRKHHCRFCGQIFCSDCTLFISYNQHKEERKNHIKSNTSKTLYHDKLRVCNPCYSDVIVYLSDDSSSSSDPETENEVAVEDHEDSNANFKANSEDTLIPNHPLSRIRSVSINSRRDSMINEQAVLAANKNFLNKESTPSMDSVPPTISASPFSGVSPTRNSNKVPVRFANENIVVYPRQAPQMAIPTTRTGEAVEIPLSKNSYSSSNIAINNTTPFGTVNPASTHHHHHHHLHHHPFGTNSSGGPEPYNFYGNGSNKTRFKNYAQLRVANMSSPDLLRKNSYDNISNMYSSLMGRKVSNNKLRNKTSSEKDLRVLKNRDSQAGLSGSEGELDDDDDEADSEDSQDGDNESEIEDEQAMSLYTLLNQQGFNNGQLSPKPTATSSVVMPTLGEFPSMVSDKIFPGGKSSLNGSKLFQSSNPISTFGTVGGQSQKTHAFAFLEELPKSESLRSRERAHASIERMRSRRKTKSIRNILILTQNNNRLPSVDSQSHKLNIFKYSPTSTPTSPKANPLNTIPLLGQGSLTRSLTNDKTLILPSEKVAQQFHTEKGVSLYDGEFSATAEKGNTVNTTQDYSELDHSEFDQAPNDLVLAANSEYEDLLSSFSKENTKSKEEVYQDLLDFVLKQSLEDCDIKENQDLWMAILKKTMDNINVIKLTDTLDVRQYVKIKKILGGQIEDTRVIDGLFMTKNIDSKRMSFSINNPKIALLMFPIEYLKQKEQFISLRIIHSQQSVYITNLVSRLVSMEPDIVVVGDSVCGLAETLLEEAGVTVISNTKPQVIERISRYTKADIFQSVNDLFFKKGHLGTCGKFEVKKYIFQNTIKTFSFFVGNEIESGFTIALRGGDEDLLNSVKYAAETLLPGFLNAKFEKSLFDNHFITFLKSDGNEKVIEHNEKLRKIKEDEQQNDDQEEEQMSCEFSLDSTEVVNYVKLFNERKISLSPATKFSLPMPLVNVIDSYYNFHNFFKTNQIIQNASSIEQIDDSWISDLKINIDISKLPNKEQDQLKFLRYTSDLHLKSLVNEYHSRARVWSNCMSISSYQLYPVFHKNIHVLHSTVSIKHATPCLGPNILVIDYYTDNDKCLGLFLDQSFQDSTKVCEECGESMLNHYKTYVHGNAKLDLILEKFESITAQQNYEGKNQRVMWSYCKECNYSSPIVAMNDETYYLSIGKFLELCFYGENVVSRDHNCDHDFFKSHIRCFGFNDLVIRLEYSSIDNYEVVVPKKQLEFMPEVDINLKIESFNSIKSKSSKFFQSISKRLNRVKVDTFDKAEDGLLKIDELKQKLDSQALNIEFKTLDIFNSTLPTNHLSLNFILRELQELGVDWDNEFNEFEKNFLPSELEINKITQFHLRNFLMDRDTGDQPKEDLSKSDEIDQDDNEENRGQEDLVSSQSTAHSIEDPNTEFAVTEHDLKIDLSDDKPLEDALNKEKTKELGKIIPPTLYQESILERISKIEQLLESERNGGHLRKEDLKKIPPPQPLRHLTRKGSETSETSMGSDSGGATQLTPNKVYQLANLFNKMNIDKISMEFKRQREQELKRKSHKFKALPIVESKPIVEIYDKIEDVVDVHDEHDRNNSITQTNTAQKRPTQVSTSKSIFREDEVAKKREETFNQSSLTSATTGTVSATTAAAVSKSIEIPQPEKMTLLKSLTNFWADRSATLWDPLEYPLESHEHTFADSDVIVRDDEPSSLVAFCLSSNDYKQKLDDMGKETNLSSGFDLENNEINNKKINNFSRIEKKFKKKTFNELTTLEKIMVKNKSNHLKYQFVDGNTNLSCKIFYSEQFEAFRRACGNHDNFIQSLSRCIKWNSSGGKSGSNFLKTLDDRYIVKELSKSELESFVSIAPFYFKYISQSMFNTLSTAIAKIFGFYQIQIKNTITGKTYKMDFLIMENLFYNHKTTRIFDLKGSMRNRHVKQTGKENEVLLDENMIEYIYESPVFVKEQLKKLLRGSLFNDTSFLLAMDVMDYSLVIGIDSSTKKLYIGIIDWLRTFTWDKKVENWVKGNNLIGGNKKGKDPTIVTPKQYRTRFREAMDRYLLEVPDIWYEGAKTG